MTSTLPPGRYAATTRRPRRTWVWLVTAAAVVAGIVVAFIAYQRFSVSDLDAEVKSYEIIDDSRIDVAFTVTRDDPSRDVVCIARARSRDGSETGRREVLVPGGPDSTVLITAQVFTSLPPGMGDLYGCSFDVPDYLTTP
ncbi:DUF4307 domain-containing protein [Rhodococcus sp. HNM0569]|uniref:DUF4307 domain-containing protein n=1 Tax=Rhodococcus sp. HNM0569 TaxID=2716340 RepID=UPI00146A4024|nr:DUF4307 domain-containing protein [Rhodococcus sp. HNM0569]NLU82777.1 DUF4307 domain-containing protein [Rhodococcus sp. HNM0569]